MMTGALFFSAAEDGMLPRAIARSDPRTPRRPRRCCQSIVMG